MLGQGRVVEYFVWKKPEWESYNCVDILNVARKKLHILYFVGNMEIEHITRKNEKAVWGN
jgi:hypothetical protein